ncbi:hypothetical protein BT96DRAFT_1086856 [Gymnopus androsaceus JB14]|uniref:Uncharacterized protein n=1 Tax=Gymnopus androsaceus JB14 TaxID=1447944 RepID=A0A6A4HW65_9AGAR|nr:hypothetical protein BT96DRAFT_1086856 [Gymnopus androsaceus JB14]
MQSEIWSLINHIGSPMWYITIAPCDFKHPICIYRSQPGSETDPETKHWMFSLVGNNPVAAA